MQILRIYTGGGGGIGGKRIINENHRQVIIKYIFANRCTQSKYTNTINTKRQTIIQCVGLLTQKHETLLLVHVLSWNKIKRQIFFFTKTISRYCLKLLTNESSYRFRFFQTTLYLSNNDNTLAIIQRYNHCNQNIVCVYIETNMIYG